jgi:hypothetical protein
VVSVVTYLDVARRFLKDQDREKSELREKSGGDASSPSCELSELSVDELIDATLTRIGRQYPTGCPIDTPAWNVLEQHINEAAYGDRDRLVAALQNYEAHAAVMFAAWRREHAAEVNR